MQIRNKNFVFQKNTVDTKTGTLKSQKLEFGTGIKQPPSSFYSNSFKIKKNNPAKVYYLVSDNYNKRSGFTLEGWKKIFTL